jgi:primosomal protein N' (replication factor Y)
VNARGVAVTPTTDPATGRVCRVRPDVPALDRAFDYLVPDELAERVRVGTIVRVGLHGRRVRGWVVEDDVVAETEAAKLRPLLQLVSEGPPPELVGLARWAAWRWAGSTAALLRVASPPNVVRDREPAPAPVVAGDHEPDVAPPPVRVIAWPPAADRRALVRSLLAPSGSTVIVMADGPRAQLLARELAAEGLEFRGDQPDAQRTRAWRAARRGGCVVVGGRVAVWAPVPDLAAVVVLDEGDEALQEERNPTWHARDVALERAARAGVPCSLVSPAPTLEARAAGGVVERPDRALEREGWPVVELVDLRVPTPVPGLMTEALADALHRAVDSGRRAVCVINRKGRARLLACRTCEELARCGNCGAAVGQVETPGVATELVCPRCETRRPVVCLACQGGSFRVLRAGVARLRDDLAALLPRATVADVEAATVEVPDVDVLVGTEAVLHRVPRGRRVGLVAYLDFDQELLAERFRAPEQALWLLVRAARLTGPRSRDGRILIQTRLPDDAVVVAANTADPDLVADREGPAREDLGFPPFGALAELSGDADAVAAACDGLRGIADTTVLGPTPVGERGARALIRADDPTRLADALAAAGPQGRAAGRLRIAVDPPRV